MSAALRVPFVEPAPPEGCVPVDMAGWTVRGPSFLGGENETERVRVRYFRRVDDGHLVGWAWFGPGAQGPPGQAHGGSKAALLDEAMGLAAWAQGITVVAAKITVEFRRMLPLGTIAWFEAWVESVRGRKVEVRGMLTDAEGNPFTTSDGLFIHLPRERFDQLRAEAEATRPAAEGPGA